MSLILFSDLALNVLNIGYSRAVIQNHISDFRFQRNIWHYFSRKVMERFLRMVKQNSLANVPISMFRNLGILSLKIDDCPYWGTAGLVYLGHFLSYPFITVQRRLHCQSKEPGMIPLRYSGTAS